VPDSPTKDNLNVNRLITSLVRGYSNEQYLADTVLPGLKVKKTRGTWARFDKSNLRAALNLGYIATAKQTATEFNFGTDTTTYITRLHKVRAFVDPEEIGDEDDPYDIENDLTFGMSEAMKVEKEVAFATLMFGSGNYAAGHKTVSTGKKWSVYSAASTGEFGPLRQVLSAANHVRSKVGQYPNALVVGAKTHMVLLRHPDVTDSVKYVELMTVMNASKAMAALFGVNDYWVEGAIKVTSGFKPEAHTETVADIVGDKAALILRNPGQNKRATRFGAQVQHQLYPNGDRYPDRALMNGIWIEVRDRYQMLSVDNTAGYLFDDTNA
jgi:hypothetical protein